MSGGRMVLAAAAALTLAACGHKPAAAPITGGAVLPGSASDAMIAYDALRSQPPLARDSDAAATRDIADEPQGSAPDADAAPSAPASDPAPDPAPTP